MKEYQEKSYPVVITNEKGDILARNRLAQKLLPTLSRLKVFLQKSVFSKKEIICQARLDGITYFIACLPGEEGKVYVCFLEQFLPLYEPFSRMVLEEMNAFFWELLEEEKRQEKEALFPGFLDAVAARTHRLRQEEKSYLRLLKMKNYAPCERVSCSVPGFFRHLSSALVNRGVRLFLDLPEELAVELSTEAFSLLALNLAQFAYLFEGADQIWIQAKEKRGKAELSFSFEDPNGFGKMLETLLCTEEEKIPGALLSTPLFCALCLCRKENISWKFYEEKGRLVFSVSLPLSITLPAAFLAESAAEEVRELLNLEKEWFSR